MTRQEKLFVFFFYLYDNVLFPLNLPKNHRIPDRIYLIKTKKLCINLVRRRVYDILMNSRDKHMLSC